MEGVYLMEKNKFFMARHNMARVLAIVLIFGMMFSGCATTRHGVEISNVQASNIKEVNIRTAGTANWGSNMAKHLENIDRSKFSERVDIRVIDTNGIVYSKHNVPFDDAAFAQTSKTSSINQLAVAGVLGIFGLIVMIVNL